MTSSKLSHRRSVAKKPPICIPPPPPPGLWPADRFDLRLTAHNTPPPTPPIIDVTIHLDRDVPGPTHWAGTETIGADWYSAAWTVAYNPDQAQLEIHASQSGVAIYLLSHWLAVTLGKVTYYQISAWQTVTPPTLVATAAFWF